MPLPPLPPTVATGSGREALRRILVHLRLRPSDEVWITTTLGHSGLRVSPCVTATVAGVCRFAAAPSPRTAAALVIHDYGVPHAELAAIAERCRRHGWPLIEDAAHAFASVDAAGRRAGTTGDFALYSLPKFFALANGGLAAGLPADAGDDDDAPGCQALSRLAPQVAPIAARRERNWRHLHAAVTGMGLASALTLPPGSVPSLFALRTNRQFAVLRALRAANIESGPEVHGGVVLLPCHQGLTTDDLDRIVRVVGAAVARDRAGPWRAAAGEATVALRIGLTAARDPALAPAPRGPVYSARDQ